MLVWRERFVLTFTCASLPSVLVILVVLAKRKAEYSPNNCETQRHQTEKQDIERMYMGSQLGGGRVFRLKGKDTEEHTTVLT